VKRDWWSILRALAVLTAATEVVDAFLIDAPVIAIVIAALFLSGFFFARRRQIPGALIVGILWLFELLLGLFHPRDSVAEWIVVALFVLLSASGLVATVGSLRDRLRTG
jgi:hypothetical protein